MRFPSRSGRDRSAWFVGSLLAGTALAGGAVCAGSLLGAGCGDDVRPPMPPRDMAILFDAGDGGTVGEDGGEGDAGGDGAVPIADGGMGVCRVEGAPLKLTEDVIDRSVRLVDVAVSGTTFLVTWPDARSAVTDAFAYVWPSGAASGTEVRLSDDFAPTRDLRVVGRAGGFTVAWIDTSAGSFELFTRAVSPAGTPEGPARRITNNALREDTPALARLVDGSVLTAWVESDGLGGAPVVRVVPLDAAASPVGTPVTVSVPSRVPRDPALGALGAGAALAWSEDGNVYLQPLSAMGALVGTAGRLNTEANALGAPSLALGDTGGGVAFGVLVGGARQEARMRTVARSGATDGPESILTPPPDPGGEPSLAPFATGYVAAYRTSSGGTGNGTIRLSFATALGEFAGDLEVAATGSTLGSSPRLAVAPDGRIVVVWMETDTATATFRAARVVCG
jgi:hypothetical protein